MTKINTNFGKVALPIMFHRPSLKVACGFGGFAPERPGANWAAAATARPAPPRCIGAPLEVRAVATSDPTAFAALPT